MGKLEYDQSIEHFSHEHPLELSKFKELPQNFPSTCSGCNLSCSDWLYTCKACKYVLHILCSQVPQFLHHPADPNHALTLISTPADQRDGTKHTLILLTLHSTLPIKPKASLVTYARSWDPTVGSIGVTHVILMSI
ncbi:hypothetical protein IFM89_021702 [Coptis chinensis]|uniref:DC1 domain-containing protein n=1 Tax=Coptis chinensis TaxID=261450 RepID=A0A835IZ60_9MAGN|nr:hypothetical protein IFM89_021702 [Coptis chinensis]